MPGDGLKSSNLYGWQMVCIPCYSSVLPKHYTAPSIHGILFWLEPTHPLPGWIESSPISRIRKRRGGQEVGAPQNVKVLLRPYMCVHDFDCTKSIYNCTLLSIQTAYRIHSDCVMNAHITHRRWPLWYVLLGPQFTVPGLILFAHTQMRRMNC